MAVRNLNWYNLQSTRNYPLADNATTTGDKGERFPEDLLVDCHLRWPSPAGRYAYLSAATVTPRLVTLVLLATDELDVPGGTPLAAVTLLRPVDEYRPYDLQPLLPGVGGYVVFGNVGDMFAGRFSTARQGLLDPRCARPYAPLPIPTLRKLGRDVGLEGLVRIIAGTDLAIVREQVSIQGHGLREALVIRLQSLVAVNNVLKTYIGPCDKRPESHTCDKEGIETINGVAPDCDGNLNIQVVGIPSSPFHDCSSQGGGLVMEGSTNIDEVCLAQNQPEFIHGSDYCQPGSSQGQFSSESSIATPSVSSESVFSSESFSSEYIPCLWPYETTFQDETLDWNIDSGDFLLGEGVYTSVNGGRRNVSTWNGGSCHLDSLNKRCTLELALTNHYININGGMVLNYHIVNPVHNPHPEYFLVDLDRPNNAVVLRRFNGTMTVTEHSVPAPEPIDLDRWYRITATTRPAADGNVLLSVLVEAVDGAWGPVSFSLATSKYGLADGTFGIGTDRAQTVARYFRLEDL